MEQPPKVFVSYSHDSAEHKQWVLNLCTKLRDNKVDVILDQWDLGPGADATLFMENGVRDSNKILVICTDNYVSKVDAAEGGVGYERMILIGELVDDLRTDKFIPIIRQPSGQEQRPTCLKTRIFINFTDDNQFDEKLIELLHVLHQVPLVEKPQLGESPFAQRPSVEVAPRSGGLESQPTYISNRVESASEAYAKATEIAQAEDLFEWQQLIKRHKPAVFNSLVQWRQHGCDEPQQDSQGRFQVVDKAIEIVSPLVCIALAGVEACKKQFRDQKSILEDLLNIPGWIRVNDRVWSNIPYALGYVYHSLHGCVSLHTNQLDLALNLARVKTPVANGRRYLQVWERSELRGYSESISGNRGGNCMQSWRYLTEACERQEWEWLSLIFSDKLEYRTSLVAYYMTLNIHELATIIASGKMNTFNASSNPYFHIPLTFLSEDYNTTQRAISLLIRNPEALSILWTSVQVTQEQMESAWPNWVRLSEKEILRYSSTSFPIALQNLSDIYQHLFEGM